MQSSLGNNTISGHFHPLRTNLNLTVLQLQQQQQQQQYIVSSIPSLPSNSFSEMSRISPVFEEANLSYKDTNGSQKQSLQSSSTSQLNQPQSSLGSSALQRSNFNGRGQNSINESLSRYKSIMSAFKKTEGSIPIKQPQQQQPMQQTNVQQTILHHQEFSLNDSTTEIFPSTTRSKRSIVSENMSDSQGFISHKSGVERMTSDLRNLREKEGSDKNSDLSNNSFDNDLSDRLKEIEKTRRFQQNSSSIVAAALSEAAPLTSHYPSIPRKLTDLSSNSTSPNLHHSHQSAQLGRWENQRNEEDDDEFNQSNREVFEESLHASRLVEAELSNNVTRSEHSMIGINQRFKNSTFHNKCSFLDNMRADSRVEETLNNDEDDEEEEEQEQEDDYKFHEELNQQSINNFIQRLLPSEFQPHHIREQEHQREYAYQQYENTNQAEIIPSLTESALYDLNSEGEGQSHGDQSSQWDLRQQNFPEDQYGYGKSNVIHTYQQSDTRSPQQWIYTQQSKKSYKYDQETLQIGGSPSSDLRYPRQNYTGQSQGQVYEDQSMSDTRRSGERGGISQQYEVAGSEENSGSVISNGTLQDINSSDRERKRFTDRSMKYSSMSESETDTLNEVISSPETRGFIRKYFSRVDQGIPFDRFLESLQREFVGLLVFKKQVEFEAFEDELRVKLTTGDESQVSLNALQIFTKGSSLKDKIIAVILSVRTGDEQRTKVQVNEKIAEEINSISKMLEAKSKQLAKKEKALAEKQFAVQQQEEALRQRQSTMKEFLKSEYEVMLATLDEAVKERMVEVTKKTTALEKSIKAKVKIIESKAKECKTISTTSSSQVEKLRAKVASQEKQNEFLKTKLQDCEKKLATEEARNATFNQKHEILLKKFRDVEKLLKEQDHLISHLNSEQQQSLRSARYNEDQVLSHSAAFSYSETGMDSQSLIASGEKNIYNMASRNQQGLPSLIHGQSDIESICADDYEGGETTIHDIQAELHNGNNLRGLMAWSEQPQAEIPVERSLGGTAFTIPVGEKKKVSSVSAIGGAKKKQAIVGAVGAVTTLEEEVKVLLGIIETILSNTKKTLPLILSHHDKLALNQSVNQSVISSESIEFGVYRPPLVDVGELFYPCFNNLVSGIVEVLPSLLSKHYNPSDLHGIVHLMSRAIGFKCKYLANLRQKTNTREQSFLLSEEILESTRTFNKSGQDHINEIMMAPKQPMQLTFLPQTAFWKRKVKIVKKQPVSTTLSRLSQQQQLSSGPSQQAHFLLFSNEDIQKEMVAVFKAYLDHSEILLKRKIGTQMSLNQGTTMTMSTGGVGMTIEFGEKSRGDDGKSMTKSSTASSIENHKIILMTRIDLLVTTLILQVNTKDSIFAIQQLLQDTSNDNESLNDYLRSYLIAGGLVQILAWRMEKSREDTALVGLAVDLMLSLNTNGSHYKQFIEEISEDSVVSILIRVFEKSPIHSEVSEKLSVVLQRITYHSPDMKTRLGQKQVSILRNKLNEITSQKHQNARDLDFLLQNLKSIILNIS